MMLGDPQGATIPDYPVGRATDITWPGLRGYVWNRGRRGLNVPWISAVEPGHGACGEFIAALQAKYPTVRFPCVISAILQGMLERRGFRLEYEWSPRFEEYVDLMTWRRSGKYRRAQT